MGATLGTQVPTGDMGSCRGTGGPGYLAQCKYNRLSEYLYTVKFITDVDMDTSKKKNPEAPGGKKQPVLQCLWGPACQTQACTAKPWGNGLSTSPSLLLVSLGMGHQQLGAVAAWLKALW